MALSDSEKQKNAEDRRRSAGLVPVKDYVPEGRRQDIKDLAKKLRGGLSPSDYCKEKLGEE